MHRYAVLDTNILVPALMRPDGPPGHVMAAVNRGELVPIVSAAILAEYDAVPRRPRLRLDPAKVEAALATMRAIDIGAPGDEPAAPADLPDASDWPFIACALAAGCPVVTGKLKHFPKAAGVVALTPGRWVAGQVGG